MNKQTRFIAFLGLLLMGGAVNAHAQGMGQVIPSSTGSDGRNTIVGQMAGADGSAGVLGATPVKLTGFSTASGKPSAAKQFTISGVAEGAHLTAPQGFEVSSAEAGEYSSSLDVRNLPATIWVRLTGSKPNGAASISGDISMSGSSELTGSSVTVKMHVEGVVK